MSNRSYRWTLAAVGVLYLALAAYFAALLAHGLAS